MIMNKLVAETLRLQDGSFTYTGRTFLAGGDATVDEIIAHAHRHWSSWDSIMIHSSDGAMQLDSTV